MKREAGGDKDSIAMAYPSQDVGHVDTALLCARGMDGVVHQVLCVHKVEN